MKWLAKALALKALSALPCGEKLYNWGQKNVTRSLDPTSDRVRGKVDVALLYLDTLDRLGAIPDLAKISHLDLGSGWHPTIPFYFYSAGCERQWLFDVVPLLDTGLFHRTLATFKSVVSAPEHPAHRRVRRLPEVDASAALPDALRTVGMTYVAPYAETLNGMSNAVDLATCTQALQHVEPDHLRTLFGAIFRALKPGGYFLATVHLKDLYANLGGISHYNHLRYSPSTWKTFVNSRLISFNRLKAPDFREMLEGAGFGLPHFEVEHGTPADLAELDGLRIDPSFAHYSREDLAAKHLFFVARKP